MNINSVNDYGLGSKFSMAGLKKTFNISVCAFKSPIFAWQAFNYKIVNILTKDKQSQHLLLVLMPRLLLYIGYYIIVIGSGIYLFYLTNDLHHTFPGTIRCDSDSETESQWEGVDSKKKIKITNPEDKGKQPEEIITDTKVVDPTLAKANETSSTRATHPSEYGKNFISPTSSASRLEQVLATMLATQGENYWIGESAVDEQREFREKITTQRIQATQDSIKSLMEVEQQKKQDTSSSPSGSNSEVVIDNKRNRTLIDKNNQEESTKMKSNDNNDK